MTRLKWMIALSFSITALSVGAATPKRWQIKRQWRLSAHADSMNTKKERIRMNTPECAHCHTAQGYWHEILDRGISEAPYKKAVGITCIACHETEKGRATPALRVGDVASACSGCHDILVKNDESLFSSCPQGSMLKGKAGAQLGRKNYRIGAHSQIEKKCAGCHMAPPPKGEHRVGGHTFRVISKGKGPRIFNPTGCVACHDDITYEWVKQSQEEVKALIKTLEKLLPIHHSEDPEKTEPRPKYPQDPSLTPIQSQAAFNYWEVVKDGTFGVHNPVYIRDLLNASIRALKKNHPSVQNH
ncbi:MAG: cytochrome c3 family protein [Myxococcota bacterium]|nr:cytochrome c3 family protein [Myxococcota bacterium]